MAKDWYVLQNTIRKNTSHSTKICFKSAESQFDNHQVDISSDYISNQKQESEENKHICSNGLNNNHLLLRNSIENLHKTSNSILKSENDNCDHQYKNSDESKCRVHFSTNDSKLNRENYPFKDDLIEEAITQLSHSLNISNLKDQQSPPTEKIVAKLFSRNFRHVRNSEDSKSHSRKLDQRNNVMQVVHDTFDRHQNREYDKSDSRPNSLRNPSSVSDAEAILCCSKLLEYCSTRTHQQDHYWEYIRNISKLIEDIVKNGTSDEDSSKKVAHMSITPRTEMHHQFKITDTNSDLGLDTLNSLLRHTYYCTKHNLKKD